MLLRKVSMRTIPPGAIMSQFHANRLLQALEACTGDDDDADSKVDEVLRTIPWHEIEVISADTDALHDAVTYALATWQPPNLSRPH